MKIRELGEICKKIKVDCDDCQYKNYCMNKLPEILEEISPFGLLTILDEEVDE